MGGAEELPTGVGNCICVYVYNNNIHIRSMYVHNMCICNYVFVQYVRT